MRWKALQTTLVRLLLSVTEVCARRASLRGKNKITVVKRRVSGIIIVQKIESPQRC